MYPGWMKILMWGFISENIFIYWETFPEQMSLFERGVDVFVWKNTDATVIFSPPVGTKCPRRRLEHISGGIREDD